MPICLVLALECGKRILRKEVKVTVRELPEEILTPGDCEAEEIERVKAHARIFTIIPKR